MAAPLESNLISIIVPTRNSRAAILETLTAIEAMEIPEGCKRELVVVDNASTDDTRTHLSEWATTRPWVKVIQEEKPGASCARNAGARHAQGSLFVFCDDDVIPHPRFLIELDKALKPQPWLQVVCGSILPIPLRNLRFQRFRTDLYKRSTKGTGNSLATEVGGEWTPVVAGALFAIKKSVFEWTGGFDESLKRLEDSIFTLHLLKSGFSILALMDPVGGVYYRPDSFLRYALRSYHGAKGFEALFRELPLVKHRVVRKGFPLPDFRAPWMTYQWVREVLQVIGYVVGRFEQKNQRSNPRVPPLYPLAQFAFKLVQGRNQYLLSPGVAFIFLPESVKIYKAGYFQESCGKTEKTFLIALANQKLNSLTSLPDFFLRWLDRGIFFLSQ